MKWTPQQQQAIDGRNGTMLVSAAAGSGKTAVLVERVMQRLCDKEHPCGIENLLIVTFTKAAAAQMKDKISAKLSEKTALEPDNKSLRLCKMMLPYANICTIDSFCVNLVRDNFHSLDISPDFSILDEGSELKILKNKAMLQVINDFHRDRAEDFTRLNNVLNGGSDDRNLISAVEQLYELAMANIFPDYWLDELCRKYDDPQPPESTVWGKIILKETKNIINEAYGKCLYCLELADSDPAVKLSYGDALMNDKIIIENYLSVFENGGWDEIFEAAQKLSFGSIGRIKGDYDPAIKETVSATRKTYAAKDALSGALCKNYISEADHFADMAILAPTVRTLVDTVKAYKACLDELKKEANGYGFGDILHFTLDLLVSNENGKPVRKELAKELGKNYEEILVDEYQDVSRAQDAVFFALSRDDTNRFMVGDVKQSIYSFRQAMPEVFTDLRKSMTAFDGMNYPATVTLGNNFRSRKGITETVNFIFSRLMTEESGDIDYNENEYLYCSAPYPERDEPDTEVCLIETESENYLKAQANYIADYIKKSVSSGMTVTDGDKQRKAEYRDFCILLRKVSGGVAGVYAEALENAGIPVVASSDEPFLLSPEIAFMTSLLKVIDNPVDDIPLSAVLLSPAFGFTPDDLAEMRIAEREASFYSCVVKSAKSGNEKAAAFIDKLEKMRRISVTLSAGEFTARIIDEIGYRAIVSAMKNGEDRVRNLNSFIDVAARYEVNGTKGVSGFVRFLDKLADKEAVKAEPKKTDAANAVRIMSVHKSKGLEFPVVFLANCEKKNNDQSLKSPFIIGKKCGAGIKCISGEAIYDTLPHCAAAIESRNSSHSEELRVLYVALTRAKEKTVILASAEDWSKSLQKLGTGCLIKGGSDAYRIIKLGSFAEYILYTLIRHPDAHALRKAAGLTSKIHEPCETRLKAEIITGNAQAPEREEETADFEVSDELRKEIKDRLDFVYPYDELKSVVAKRIASDMDGEAFNEEYFASEKPAFASRDKLTPAQRGVATHRFMQFSDYHRVKSDFEAELNRLVNEEMLTEAEAKAVDPLAIKTFFESGLADRILSAEKVFKEYAFTISLPVSDLYTDIPAEKLENEVIIVEGVVDCAFVEDGKLVIVDYKTDRAACAEELTEKYSSQLGIYRKCLSMVLNMPVKETVIYSFRLGTEIIL